MNIFKTTLCILTLSLTYTLSAQDSTVTNDTKMDKKSYYQKRAEEDAKFEQQFKTENKEESEAFWQEQKAYEKELKKKDRQAYKAYMNGKRDAYAEHYEHCDNHCHHNSHYYSHASFYYYRYDGYYYNRQPQRRSTINTRVSLGAPSVRVGLGI